MDKNNLMMLCYGILQNYEYTNSSLIHSQALEQPVKKSNLFSYTH